MRSLGLRIGIAAAYPAPPPDQRGGKGKGARAAFQPLSDPLLRTAEEPGTVRRDNSASAKRFCTISLLAALLAVPARAAQVQEACGTCHPGVKTEYRDGIHSQALGCTACHGGDPTTDDIEAAHAPAKGYIGKPGRADIPALCGTCHADANRMNRFSLPTDQYAQYQTSVHGRRLAEGDTHVAVCTDCHGTHHILPAREPTSPVARRNISTTCGRCHADAALMAEYKLPADQVEKFRHSVHGIALFDEEHPLAPTCATCHGAHGAIAPAVGSIRDVCGHCHGRTREYFNEGPHRAAADAGKMSECLSCHAYHDTAHPDATVFDTTCPSCHAPDTAAFATAQQLKTLLSQSQDAVATADDEIARAASVSPTIARLRPRLQQGWAYVTEALPVQHSLNVDRVGDLTRSARSISDEVRGAVHGVEEENRLRYLWLAIAWVAILFTVGVTYAYRRERQRQRRVLGIRNS